MIPTILESILFASGKPVALSVLKKTLDVSDKALLDAVSDLKSRFNKTSSGIHLIEADGKIQFVTNPEQSESVKAFLKQEVLGELTRPSLETLTIIAYRGPITKPEIEQIRGVNCGLILRNLLMRGLIDETESIERLQQVYSVSADFLRHLGLHKVSDLPDYEDLHGNEKISRLLLELAEKSTQI